jgi:hypothetical protein
MVTTVRMSHRTQIHTLFCLVAVSNEILVFQGGCNEDYYLLGRSVVYGVVKVHECF